MQGSDGNFYGTTEFGGTNSQGTVFRISPTGSYTTFHSFVRTLDGAFPVGGLVQGNDGNFYGTASSGGAYTNSQGSNGTVFRISPSGSATNLHSFGKLTDGAAPNAKLVQGNDGYFYGTTVAGGVPGHGTVFRISSSGSYTTLYMFAGSPDGSYPQAGLVQASDGDFYGTTYDGGVNNEGTVFRISPSGSYTTLYSFAGSDGIIPEAGLVQGSDGNLYGATEFGGNSSGNGTVFRISPSGSYTALYSFVGSPNDGSHPVALLVQGSDGNFYSTTRRGGTTDNGTVFQISPSGSYTSLYSFASTPDGADPNTAGLVQGSDGNFYGTTSKGGYINKGTVFELIVPLSRPPNRISGIQMVGTDVVLAIPSIAGETYQLQFTADLSGGSWSNVPGASVTNSIGALLTATNFGGAIGPQGFYRFDITP